MDFKIFAYGLLVIKYKNPYKDTYMNSQINVPCNKAFLFEIMSNN